MKVQCTICLEPLDPGLANDLYATQCGHVFHRPCLRDWLQRSQTCPQCRGIVTEQTIFRLFFEINTDDPQISGSQWKRVLDQIPLLHAQIQAKERELQQVISDGAIKINILEIEKNEARNSVHEATITINNLSVSLQQREQKNMNYKMTIATYQQALNESNSTIEKLKQERAIISKKLAESNANVSILHANSEEKDKQMHRYSQQVSELQDNIQQLQVMNASALESVEQSRRVVSAMKAEMELMDRQVLSATKQEERSREENKILKNMLKLPQRHDDLNLQEDIRQREQELGFLKLMMVQNSLMSADAMMADISNCSHSLTALPSSCFSNENPRPISRHTELVDSLRRQLQEQDNKMKQLSRHLRVLGEQSNSFNTHSVIKHTTSASRLAKRPFEECMDESNPADGGFIPMSDCMTVADLSHKRRKILDGSEVPFYSQLVEI